MRQLVIFGCIVLFIVACSSKNKVPKGILAKQEMEDVLWDLFRGGEMLESYTLPKDSSNDKRAIAQGWYDEIFRLHKTERSSFQKSYTWYKKHRNEFLGKVGIGHRVGWNFQALNVVKRFF